jgi:hypothetical protein
VGLSGHAGKRGAEFDRHHGTECVQGFVSTVEPGDLFSMPDRIVDVVEALNAGVASGEVFFVTVTDDEGGTGTFARDNWESLPPFCYSRDRLAFVVRRYEA